MVHARIAMPDDRDEIAPRIAAFYAEEDIVHDGEIVRTGLERLLRNPDLGYVLLFEVDGAVIGYGTLTFCFDIEYGGRDAFLTDLWLDPAHRGQGHGRAALAAAERV